MMNDSDRILEEYKKDLDLNKAIETIRRENEIAERLAQQKIDDERRAQEAAHAKAIKEAEEKAAKDKNYVKDYEFTVIQTRTIKIVIDVPEDPTQKGSGASTGLISKSINQGCVGVLIEEMSTPKTGF